MKIIRQVVNAAKDKKLRFSYLARLGLLKKIPDRKYLEKRYNIITGENLNLECPRTYNEKIQWLKLYDRNDIYTIMVDKNAAKKYVQQIIGEKYVIPNLGVWDKFEDIDFSTLPNQFVLKCTHDSGGNVIIKDKSKMNYSQVKQTINKFLKRDYYVISREWPYKNVPHRIIAEEYLTDESGTQLKDYKVFCFNGVPKLIQVDFDRFVEHKRNLYTPDWKYINASIQFPTDPSRIITKPQVLEEMLRVAGELSTGLPHVRIDFYCIRDRLLFGEFTFYHGSGYERFNPKELEITMGEWISLPQKPR